MLRLLFSLVALDLFLGGGGRLLSYGPLSLRMVLFGVALLVTAAWLVARPGGWRAADGQERLALAIVAAFLATHLGAALMGLAGRQPLADIGTDLKPLVFAFIAPFFALCIKTPRDVALVARLIRWAGPLLAVAYLAAWAGLSLRIIDFSVVYPLMHETGEFYFRGETFFFYKGFLYLGIALIFLVAHRRWFALPLALLVAVALVLSLTRGFLLATSIALLALLALRKPRALLVTVPLVLAAWLLVLGWLPSLDTAYLEQREQSNSVRQDDWAFFVENVDPLTLLVGTGFGTEFNDRLAIENTYLWVIWKAGLAGLAFWLAPLVMATRWFAVALRSPRHATMASAWWCSLLLVYVQTATNPFLNNPIGMSIVLMAVLALRALALHSPPAAVAASPLAAASVPRGAHA